MIDPKVSEYFRQLALKRKDNNRGFNNPEVVRRAIEKRKANKEANNQSVKEKS